MLTLLLLICAAAAAPTLSAPDVKELLDTTYTDKSEKPVTLSDLAGKHIALYFSASWCSGCREYTPKLVELYNKLHASKDWEVIWVTHDETETDADGYYKEMPWLRLPWSEVKERGIQMWEELADVGYIPALTMIGPDFKIINNQCTDNTIDNPGGFPWPLDLE